MKTSAMLQLQTWLMEEVRLSSNLAGCETTRISCRILKHTLEFTVTAGLGDNSLQVYYQERPFLHDIPFKPSHLASVILT